MVANDDKREQGQLLVRHVLDAALIDAPSDILTDGFDRIGSGVTSFLALRMTRAFADAGWALASSTGWKRVDGVRQRMELEDLIDGTLFSCGREVIGLMKSGDHAARVAGREYVARRIWEALHHKKAVLRRVRR